MNLVDDLNMAGRLTLRKCTPEGRLVEEVTAHNDITIHGRDLVARLFRKDESPTIARVTKMHVGSSQTPFNPQDKALGSKVGETDIAKIELSEVADGGGKPRKLLRLTGELDEGDSNGELREAGLFTQDGVMYNRVTFATITKSNQFKLTLVWEITF